MQLSIYTISKTIFEGQIKRVTLPSTNGQLSILENHEPLTTIASAGTIEIETEKGEIITFAINNAIIQVLPENHTIINADLHIK